MGVTVQCESCRNTDRYDSGEIYERLIGEWAVNCSRCGEPVFVMKIDKAGLPQGSFTKKRSVEERAMISDIREYWIQEYFKDNFNKYEGISDVEGPFGTGPDFKGKIRGKEVMIEVERDCGCYLKHRHHLDSRFDKVELLVVLNPVEPKNSEGLPANILFIDIPDFVEWFKPKARDYAIQKQRMQVVDRIAGYFKKLYYYECGDKERDMATCPYCELCPYFGGGGGEGWVAFQDMAASFITYNGIGKETDEKFDIDKMDKEKIHEFYYEYGDAFLI